jgi:hypothetical protein
VQEAALAGLAGDDGSDARAIVAAVDALLIPDALPPFAGA